ncbi:MAG: hypothetical protein JKY37_07205 [Nannocystaceae bacterium]|nr:hypothetical protein [Nannocystaceae bacterium]
MDIAAGHRRVYGITEPDRRLRCWGGGNRGGHEVDLSDVVGAAMGELHTCVLDGKGSVLCWGNNDRGQLGDGSRTYRAQPTPVDLPTVLAIEARPDSTCALLESGTVSCWGANTVPGDTRRLRPSIVLELDDVEQLLGPGRAQRTDGSIVEWKPVDHLPADFTGPNLVAGKSSGYTVGPA